MERDFLVRGNDVLNTRLFGRIVCFFLFRFK